MGPCSSGTTGSATRRTDWGWHLNTSEFPVEGQQRFGVLGDPPSFNGKTGRGGCRGRGTCVPIKVGKKPEQREDVRGGACLFVLRLCLPVKKDKGSCLNLVSTPPGEGQRGGREKSPGSVISFIGKH